MPAWLARSYPRSTAVQEVAGSTGSSGPAYLPVETFPPTSDSSRAAVGGRQKDGHLVLVNGLEAYKSGNSVVRGTNRLQNDLNCVDGDVKPQQNKQIIVK